MPGEQGNRQEQTLPPHPRWQLLLDIGSIPAVILLILGLTLSWVAYGEYQQIKEAEFRLLEAHSRNASVQVSGALNRVQRMLSQIAGTQQASHPLADKALAALVDAYRAELPELGVLLVADAAGRIRRATNSTMVGKNISGKDYFSAHLDRSRPPTLFISRPEKPLLGGVSMVFSLPMRDAKAKFLGVIGITVGFRFFPQVLQTINPDDSASMSVIFNRHGDLLFRRNEPEKFFGTNISKISSVFNTHRNSGTAVTHHLGPSAHNGKLRLFLVHDVGDSGLSLILSRQLDEVLASWRNTVTGYALIFIFTGVMLVYLSHVAVQRKRQILAGKAFSEQLIATANVMVLGLDPQCRITIFNETAERISGYDRQEVLGRCWIELAVPPQAACSVRGMFEHFGQGGALPHALEYPILTKTGQERTIAWQNSVMAQPRAAISFGIDVTERKLMELALVAAKQEAEDANMGKSKFLAAASHDLRQPIHAQGLFLEVLSRTELNAQQRGLLASTRAASDASADMLNTLLDFSRIEAGVIEPQRQAFRVQPLLNKIEREFERQADAKGLAYRSRETTLVAQSDPALIELILRNLVSNAIRYTDEGGVLVTCRQRAGQVVLEVWDTGIGITASQQREVFREFHQLGNPERDRRKGLGLGLAIVEGLARTLGHALSMVSIPGRGSVFRLTLPTAMTPAIAAELSPLMAKSQQLDMRVLVIDDEESVRVGMLHLLRSWGCDCMAAESIEDALALARQQAPDFVISDYRLREQRTGIEAIAALRALLGDALPALLVTGDTAPERLRQAQASGIPLLNKPVSPSQLYRAMMRLAHSPPVFYL